MAVSKRTRFEVLRRDNYTCRYCRSTESGLTIDHVTPTALGGTDDPSNLVAACKDCNAGKTSTSPDGLLVADVKQDELRWAAAIKEAAAIKTSQREALEDYLTQFLSRWPRWVPRNWESSLTGIYEAGLPVEEMIDAVHIAQSARGVDSRFPYFTGVCWRKIRDLQEIAKSLLEVDRGAH